jgi:hypothetical protein
MAVVLARCLNICPIYQYATADFSVLYGFLKLSFDLKKYGFCSVFRRLSAL